MVHAILWRGHGVALGAYLDGPLDVQQDVEALVDCEQGQPQRRVEVG